VLSAPRSGQGTAAKGGGRDRIYASLPWQNKESLPGYMGSKCRRLVWRNTRPPRVKANVLETSHGQAPSLPRRDCARECCQTAMRSLPLFPCGRGCPSGGEAERGRVRGREQTRAARLLPSPGSLLANARNSPPSPARGEGNLISIFRFTRTKVRKAERRQSHCRQSPHASGARVAPRKGGLRRPPLAGALACRRSTTVLPKGCVVPWCDPGQASWKGFPSQFQRRTSHTGRNAGRHDARTAREQS